MKRRLNFLFVDLLVGLFFGLFSALTVADEAPSPAALFAATLPNADNRAVALAGYRGKPLIVNFWARWCPPCRAEIPELIDFRAAHRGQIEVLGIGIEDDARAVKEFAKVYAINYPLFVAGEQGIPLMKELGNTRGGLPYTVFIDRQGQIVGKKTGQIKAADLAAVAEILLKK
jgi:thiol-disulfide isomerase/thioredoxin